MKSFLFGRVSVVSFVAMTTLCITQVGIAEPVTGRGQVNSSLISPNAMGAGTAFFTAFNYNHFFNSVGSNEANWLTGFIFGHPHKNIGIILDANVNVLGIRNQPFAQNANFAVRFNHYITDQTAVAVGSGNFAGYGVFQHYADSFYGAVTHSNKIANFPVIFNFGAGTGALYSLKSFVKNRDDQIKPFGGFGVTVVKNLTLLVDITASEVSSGASYVFRLGRLPFFVSVMGANLNKAQHQSRRFRANAGFGIPF